MRTVMHVNSLYMEDVMGIETDSLVTSNA
ncbi:hypothetical protein B4U79_01215 [Dinothrombium tinctorium]|uniref:Uncharacterized protein n=1 Tax=Dinothrombium tinctorium TaxID=1965070 RepID=A0A3S3RNV5_9ACAR|nr:hypothetical protein B4U79_15315 [Dinothrombium tinctorium]RWS03788.1 hypothetical protein B4U79_07725 [Dinothrombium tinctorium]RWS06409.1 hypothetical protein B4U79_01215 [Dinothrombium tinctorium]